MSQPTSQDTMTRPPRPMGPTNPSEPPTSLSQPPTVSQQQQQQQPQLQTQSQPQPQAQPQPQPQPQAQSQQQSTHQPTRPQIATPISGIPTQVRPGEYLVLLAPNPRQPGVQGIRYPYLPLQRHQMMPTPGTTIIQRPALIRGVGQQSFNVHPTVIPTSQPFGIANVPASIGATSGSPLIHQASSSVSPAITAPTHMTQNDALAKGTHFLNALLARMHIKSKKIYLQNLIQALVDGTKSPEEFALELHKELNSTPQSQLVPFLTLMLPALRHSMNTGQTKLPGVRPPNMQTQVSVQQPNEIIQVSSMPSASSPIKDTQSVKPMTTNDVNATPLVAKTPPATATITNAAASAAPPASSGPGQTAAAKKKKTPLPPGQKSAYAIKKEAREARKRERELAAQNIKVEKVDVPDGEQKVEKSPAKPKPDRPKQPKFKKTEKQLESLSATLRDDDDVNDVAAMGGVNLAEESQKIMASGAELVGTQIRSCKDEAFFDLTVLTNKISAITKKHDLPGPSKEVVTLISHALQERLKDIVERLGVLAEHRAENLRLNLRYEISRDIKAQVKFLAELDKIEKRRYEEQERELLLRVAKSRSKVEDPEQIKLRQKAKDMQRAEQEEVRQREANQTALLALGPRKKMKTDTMSSLSSFSHTSSALKDTKPGELRTDIRRVKRVNMRDLQVLLELDRIYLDRLVKISAS